MKTTDFKTWLEEAGPEGWEEIWALGHVLQAEGEYTPYRSKINGDMIFVTKSSSEHSGTLQIFTSKAKGAFISMMEYRFCGSMNWELYCHTERAMEKDD